jgi:hypothetical protein
LKPRVQGTKQVVGRAAIVFVIVEPVAAVTVVTVAGLVVLEVNQTHDAGFQNTISRELAT